MLAFTTREFERCGNFWDVAHCAFTWSGLLEVYLGLCYPLCLLARSPNQPTELDLQTNRATVSSSLLHPMLILDVLKHLSSDRFPIPFPTKAMTKPAKASAEATRCIGD